MAFLQPKRVIRVVLALAGGTLFGFHGWLLATQVAQGALDDPWVVFRWIVATLLVVALVSLHRQGESMWGRKAIAVWTLAAILHAPAIAKNSPVDLGPLPEVAVVTMAQVMATAGLGVGIWLLAGLLTARSAAVMAIVEWLDRIAPPRALSPSLAPRFGSRPPPARR